ncbi:MAG: LysR family transcriptional regulator [Chloroflexi bacterium]|nr:LysR family transcriptional regulator [Chloroflexota bacterium]MCA2002492.1 LysR family transcriptional regulator [Chloroflexota bacterium]
MVDIQKIETFLCTAENENLTEAAKQLHLTQPAVSHQIKSLEQELGLKLFVRGGGRLKMTEAGELLLPWARRLLHDMNELKEMMSSAQDVCAGELRIVCSTCIGKYLLPQLAARFCRRYPNIKVRILACEPERTALRLLEGDAHLGIVSRETNDKGVELQEFFQDKIELVVPARHRWAERSFIEPSEIIREPMLIREQTSGTRWVMLSELAKFDISLEDLNIFMEVGSAEGIMEAVSNGYGVSFVSKLASQHLRDLGRAVSVPLHGVNMKRVTYMARKRGSAPHRPRDAFWSFIHAAENADLLRTK